MSTHDKEQKQEEEILNEDITTPTAESTDASAQETSIEESGETNLQEELDKINDQHLRLMAEYDNFRKRTLKEKSELIKSGGERVLKELLPVVDDFELALKHASESKAQDDPVVEGIFLIYNKFIDYLNKQGVVKIETDGATFDDNLHEAIALVPAPEKEQKGKVIDCVRTGYMLHDKVLRHAHVVVGN